jgi:hypothetical protein
MYVASLQSLRLPSSGYTHWINTPRSGAEYPWEIHLNLYYFSHGCSVDNHSSQDIEAFSVYFKFVFPLYIHRNNLSRRWTLPAPDNQAFQSLALALGVNTD